MEGAELYLEVVELYEVRVDAIGAAWHRFRPKLRRADALIRGRLRRCHCLTQEDDKGRQAKVPLEKAIAAYCKAGEWNKASEALGRCLWRD